MLNSRNKKITFATAVILTSLILIWSGFILVKKISGSGNPLPSVTSAQTPSPTITPVPSFTVTPTLGKSSKKPTSTPKISPSVNPVEVTSATPTASVTPSIASFTVTAVTVSIDSDIYNGSCITPKTFTFTAQITTNGVGTVTYKWLRSDGASSSTPQTVTFSSSGTQSVTTSWTLGTAGFSYTGGEKMQIVSPNSLESNQASFTLNCS